MAPTYQGPRQRENSRLHRRAETGGALPGSGAEMMGGFTARDGHCFVRVTGEEKIQLQRLRNVRVCAAAQLACA